MLSSPDEMKQFPLASKVPHVKANVLMLTLCWICKTSVKRNRESLWGGELKRLQIIVCVDLLLFQVRLAALKVLEGFHARLGEDFMVLLPETIPFLAELMEGKSRKLAKEFSFRKLFALTENSTLFLRSRWELWCRRAVSTRYFEDWTSFGRASSKILLMIIRSL